MSSCIILFLPTCASIPSPPSYQLADLLVNCSDILLSKPFAFSFYKCIEHIRGSFLQLQCYINYWYGTYFLLRHIYLLSSKSTSVE